jgi:hypothetical protein
VVVDTADLHQCARLSWATEGSATGHFFALVRMVCCGHSQTGSLNYTATPPLVGATAIFELASWLCPSRLRRPPYVGSGSRRLAARSRPS